MYIYIYISICLNEHIPQTNTNVPLLLANIGLLAPDMRYVLQLCKHRADLSTGVVECLRSF
jgi:hypothetical protein